MKTFNSLSDVKTAFNLDGVLTYGEQSFVSYPRIDINLVDNADSLCSIQLGYQTITGEHISNDIADCANELLIAAMRQYNSGDYFDVSVLLVDDPKNKYRVIFTFNEDDALPTEFNLESVSGVLEILQTF